MQQIPPEHDSINVVTPETEPSRAATKPGKNLGRAEQKSTTIYLCYGPTQIDIYIIAWINIILKTSTNDEIHKI